MTFNVLSSRSWPRVFAATIITVGLMTSFPARSASAQQVFAPSSVPPEDALTNSLLALHGRYRQAPPTLKAQALKTLVDTAVDRQQQLAALIKSNP